MENTCILTVKCICFNHEKYLKRCLDSIINQNTHYGYRILIHDDASTDNSKQIIEEYCLAYPNLITAIIQKENQTSKGINVFNLLDNYINTKYSCICECDDYWIADDKIEKQLAFLEAHEEYSVCTHGHYTVSEDERIMFANIRNGKGDHEILINEIIMNSDLPHTSSLMYRQDVAVNQPEFYNKCLVGDYPLKLYLSTMGKTYYIDEIMTCYRRHKEGSWVTKATSNPAYFRKHVELLKSMLDNFNIQTGYMYSNAVKMRQSQLDFKLLKIEKNFKDIILNDYYNNLTFIQKKKVITEMRFPNVYRLISSIYMKWKKDITYMKR